MNIAEIPSEQCSIAGTVAVIGDRWSVLVLRDLTNGLGRFDVIVRHLGIARDVLTRRLDALVCEGIIERVPYREAGQRERYEYRLTAMGWDLTMVLAAMKSWGDRYLNWPVGLPARLEHRDCGAAVVAVLRCEAGHLVAPGRELRTVPNPAVVGPPAGLSPDGETRSASQTRSAGEAQSASRTIRAPSA